MHLTIWVSKFSGNAELWFSSKEEINPISVGLAASDSGRLFARQCNLWFLCIQCNSSWEDCDLTGEEPCHEDYGTNASSIYTTTLCQAPFWWLFYITLLCSPICKWDCCVPKTHRKKKKKIQELKRQGTQKFWLILLDPHQWMSVDLHHSSCMSKISEVFFL